MDLSSQADRLQKLAYRIPELKALGGPGRDKSYKEIAAGRLRAVKDGRNTRVLAEDFAKYLQALPAIQPTNPELKTQPPQRQRRVRGKRGE